MPSPAQRYRLMCEALAAGNNQVDMVQLSAYQTLMKQYQEDKALLKSLSSVKDKVAYKNEILPHYQDWITGILASGEVNPNDSITPMILVWQLDCGQLDASLPLAQFALNKNLNIGDDYQRNMATVILEEYAEQISQGADIADANLPILIEWATAKQEGRHRYNVPDQVRAKLLKAVAEKLEDKEPHTAIDLYEQALAYNEKAGCKKQLEVLRKQFKNNA